MDALAGPKRGTPLREMSEHAQAGRSWRSDTLLIATVNAVAYYSAYWESGFRVPHFGTYICWVGAVVSLVTAPRELINSRFRRAALVGVVLSTAVLWHALTTECTGLCK